MISGAGLRAQLVRAFAAGGVAAAAPAWAQQSEAPQQDVPADIVVTGEREEKLSTPQSVLPLIDTPQTITVLDGAMLKEQGQRTLRDALRNITGISFQAGEGNPPGGGDEFSVRGFSAREDILVDGMRDPGNYFRDPFSAHRIEVTKGPASAFAGRGNVGGTVNIDTNEPQMETGGSVELTAGTHDLLRAVTDLNAVISEEHGVAMRVNGMAHSADEPGRDMARNRRWAVFPSISFGIDHDTLLRLSWLHLEQDNIPDYGVPNVRNLSFAGSPFAGRPAPVPRNSYYGYAGDYYHVNADILTARLDHAFTDSLSLRSQLRYGHVENDSIISAPLLFQDAQIGPDTRVYARTKPRDQVDTILINQTNLTWEVGSDAFHHTVVLGAELARETAENRRRNDRDGPVTSLFRPDLLPQPVHEYNGTRARMDVDTVAFYLFDTVEIGERWRIVGGLRYDDITTRVRGFDDEGRFPGYVTDLSITDRAWSGNGALIYKPSRHSSIYVAYGTAFEPSGRSEVVQLAGFTNAPPTTAESFGAGPERSEAWELGGRFQMLDDTTLVSGALFQITKTNGRTPGINPGDPAIVLDGEQRVRGLEVQVQAEVHAQWNLFAGYTYLDGEVTRSNIPAELGQRLDNLPEHSFNLWASYFVRPNLEIGGGFQHVGSRVSTLSAATGFLPITVPAYTVADLFVSWRASDTIGLRLNVFNLTDEYYFQSFFLNHSIPSAARSASLSLTVDF